jgi:putative sigma-54 modulation protein
MQLEIIDRHFTLGEEQREFIEAAVEKLVRFSPRPVQGFKLTMTHEAGQFSADAVLYLKNHDFRAQAEGREPEHAMTELAENLRRQLSKFKGKISGKQKGREGGLGEALGDVAFPAGEEGEAPENFVLRDMDVAAAREAFTAAEMPFLVFRNVANSRVGIIYRREDGELGHMESGDA